MTGLVDVAGLLTKWRSFCSAASTVILFPDTLGAPLGPQITLCTKCKDGDGHGPFRPFHFPTSLLNAGPMYNDIHYTGGGPGGGNFQH